MWQVCSNDLSSCGFRGINLRITVLVRVKPVKNSGVLSATSSSFLSDAAAIPRSISCSAGVFKYLALSYSISARNRCDELRLGCVKRTLVAEAKAVAEIASPLCLYSTAVCQSPTDSDKQDRTSRGCLSVPGVILWAAVPN